MVGERNRILELKEYLSSLGIKLNIGKTKARGNKGVFMHSLDNFRIDISKDLKEDSVLSVMLHEFAHYIHYNYDKSLKKLDFIFENYTEDLQEELINITVQDVPKDFAAALYNRKNLVSNDLQKIVKEIKLYIPDFKISENNKNIESHLNLPIKYLLRYDKVNYYGKIYSIDKLSDYGLNCVEQLYLDIKSKQRILKRLNSRINRLNKYYNNPTELFARFVEYYYMKHEYIQKVAPVAVSYMQKSKIPYIKKLNEIIL